jgi:hypothetical protein
MLPKVGLWRERIKGYGCATLMTAQQLEERKRDTNMVPLYSTRLVFTH